MGLRSQLIPRGAAFPHYRLFSERRLASSRQAARVPPPTCYNFCVMRPALICLFASLALAQPAPTLITPPGEVLGVGNFIHIVSDLDKSIEFYHDVLGMDLQLPPNAAATSGPRPFLTTPEIVSLYNATGGQYRAQSTMAGKSPMRAELVEWGNVERKAVQPRVQDPGASIMILNVSKIAPILARAKKAGVKIITTGAEPVQMADDERILLRDPDGFYIELRHAPSATDAPANNLLDVSFAFIVSDTDAMVHVFGDALGFQPRSGSFSADPAELKLFGLSKAQIRHTTSFVPGSTFPVEFLEFKGIDRKAVHSRPQDPGSPVLRLRVQDADSVVKALDATGVKVASTGGKPVTLPGGIARAAITAAPDNLFVQVLQQAAPPAPKQAGEVQIGVGSATVRLASTPPPLQQPTQPSAQNAAHLLPNEQLAALPQTPGATGDQLRHYFFKEAAHEVPYRVFVPPALSGKSGAPLLIALHGAGGTQDSLMDWGHGMLPALAEKYGYIVATPLGYPLGSSYGQHYNIGIPDSARAGSAMTDDQRKTADNLSEQDVLNVTERVAKEYSVDRKRIYLIGHSRGALASWYLGEKYRDQWAGLAMIAGGFLNTDYPYEHLRGMPVMIAQGGADTAALPERARAQVAAMKKIGLEPQYFEVPDATHGSIIDAALPGIFEFFSQHRHK